MNTITAKSTMVLGLFIGLATGVLAAPIVPVDDPAANVVSIQAAIDEATAVGGGVVELAEGLFLVADKLKVPSGVTLRGQGYEKTILKQTGSWKERPSSNTAVFTISSGATVEHLTITGIKVETKMIYSILMEGGCLSYCMVSNNVQTEMNSGMAGGVQVRGTGAVIDHCIIRENAHTFRGNTGGGIYVESGSATIDTCLVANNGGGGVNGQGSGAGIYCKATTVLLNSTIAGNEVSFTSAANARGGGVYFDTTCYVTNCLFAANVAPLCDSDGKPNWAGTTPVGANNFFGDGSATFGDNPQHAASAGFMDQRHGDYQLTAVSGAKGKGVWYAGVPVDILGVERTEQMDIGCYAFDAGSEPFSCPAQMSKTAAFVDQPVSFETTLVNPPKDGEFSYVWTLTDQFGNVRNLSDSASPSEAIPVAGFYTVSLHVSDSKSTATADFTIQQTLHIAVRTNYVTSVEGATPVYPFATPETAAVRLADAMAETIVGSTVLLDPGEHMISSTISPKADVKIIGAGPSATVVNAQGKCVVFDMTEMGALVSGACLKNAKNGAVRIGAAGSTVRNCRICAATSNIQNGHGDALSLDSAGAVVENCVIDGNFGTTIGGGDASIVYVGQGVLRNCLLTNNICSYRDATQERPVECSILRVGNAGSVENCTIAGNSTVGADNVSVALFLVQGCRVVNTIVADNVAVNNVLPADDSTAVPNWASATAGNLLNVSNCAIGDGCAALGVDAADGARINFKPYGYRLRMDSSCRNAGMFLGWMLDAVDLDGNKRVVGHKVDIGCYECPPMGLVLLLY